MTDTVLPLPAPDPDWALFLDIDGTLLDLAPTPSQVEVPPELPGLLQALSGVLDGAVAVISGRALADIDILLAPLTIAAAGQHGAEIRLPDGKIERLGAVGGALAALMPRVAAFAATHPGLLVEDKGMTIAVHYRQVPQYQNELERFLGDLAVEQDELIETIRGHRVFEIKPRNFNKRTAVEHFMRTAPFAGRNPVFIGDDRTDEDGFAAAQAQGGVAIRVGPDAPSIATRRIADPARTRAFLSRIVESLSNNAG